MKFIGIDGCKAGWFFVCFDGNGHWEVGVVSNITHLAEAIKASDVTLIDMPIGLPTKEQRERLCDLAARKVLKKRKSSIFPVSCRAAIQCKTYLEGSATNYQYTGRKLSIQSWNIAPKIKEIDDFLQDSTLRGKLREMHPEIGFWALNGGHEIAYSKKTSEGLKRRQAVLSRYCQATDAIIDHSLDTYLRKDLAKDDILDALVMAITATFSNRLLTFPEVPEVDDQGLPMEIVYAKPD